MSGGPIFIRIVVDFGALAFGVLIGWVTYRSLRREGNGAALSDIAAVISAVIGTTITGLFSTEGPSGPANPPEALGLYLIGLAIGFFALYVVSIRTALKYGTARAIAAEWMMGVESSGEEKPPAETEQEKKAMGSGPTIETVEQA